MQLSQDQVQHFSEGLFCWQSNRQPAHGASSYSTEFFRLRRLSPWPSGPDSLEDSSLATRVCAGDLGRKAVPSSDFLFQPLESRRVLLEYTGYREAAAVVGQLGDPQNQSHVELGKCWPSTRPTRASLGQSTNAG